ncbi:hypothetical protein LEP1GSC050_4153 [Leptospira broomii serovar Hurstbridge str. 5399]|uniref:Uncharacterized protein n=1 Tax=Leptospira broomii serovar Hurstbridge str. 5399 TaxID=1049789 RepID=T0GKV3_9LEPT|nr:hypothetical protein LEP1GSC050_4153 [Leptospira broomii serovar Hurstbridge str. 5399]
MARFGFTQVGIKNHEEKLVSLEKILKKQDTNEEKSAQIGFYNNIQDPSIILRRVIGVSQ